MVDLLGTWQWDDDFVESVGARSFFFPTELLRSSFVVGDGMVEPLPFVDNVELDLVALFRSKLVVLSEVRETLDLVDRPLVSGGCTECELCP